MKCNHTDMIIVAAAFLAGAILIVIYFRCCKRKYDLRKNKNQTAMKQSIESRSTTIDVSNQRTPTSKSESMND